MVRIKEAKRQGNMTMAISVEVQSYLARIVKDRPAWNAAQIKESELSAAWNMAFDSGDYLSMDEIDEILNLHF